MLELAFLGLLRVLRMQRCELFTKLSISSKRKPRSFLPLVRKTGWRKASFTVLTLEFCSWLELRSEIRIFLSLWIDAPSSVIRLSPTAPLQPGSCIRTKMINKITSSFLEKCVNNLRELVVPNPGAVYVLTTWRAGRLLLAWPGG